MSNREIDEDEEAYDRVRLEQRKEVEGMIRDAFESIQYPAGGEFFDDMNRLSGDQFNLGRALNGKYWQDITMELVHYYSSDIFLLTDEAFRYFLPAWLIGSLPEIEGDMARQPVCSILSPPPYGLKEDRDAFTRRVGPLTLEQKQAVLAYFEYLNEDYNDPEDAYVQALTHYWRQFAKAQ